MEEDKFKIHVKVGGFRLPMRVTRKEEVVYRDAERALNHVLAKYQQKYNQRSAEEVLLMTAYHFAVFLRKREFAAEASPMTDSLEELDKVLEKLLSNEE